MSEYVYNKDLSYRKYLEGIQGEIRSGNRQVTEKISSSSSGIVASVEDMKEFYGAGVDRITDGLGNISDGLETISYQLNDVTAELAGINYTLEAGFGATVGALGQVNHSIQELIHVQRTGIQVWAYNQFQIAHEAMRIQQYRDALESLNLAINGHGDHVGYKLAWQFHFEKGRILGGFVKNADLELIDDSAAEQAFLDAGRYAATDHKQPASLAYLYAGRSAYNGGRISTAIEHCNDALSLSKQIPDTWWFRGKCLMNNDDAQAALADLDKAIELDVSSAMKAGSDGDYLKHRLELDRFFEEQREKYQKRAEHHMIESQKKVSEMQSWNTSAFAQTQTSTAEKAWKRSNRLFERNTLTSLWSVPEKTKDTSGAASAAVSNTRKKMKDNLNRRFNDLANSSEAKKEQAKRFALNEYTSANLELKKLENNLLTYSYGDYKKLNAKLEKLERNLVSISKNAEAVFNSQRGAAELSGGIIGGLLGAAIGLGVGFIVGFILAFIIGFIVMIIGEIMGDQEIGNRVASAILQISVLIGIILFGIIGSISGANGLREIFKLGKK